MRLALAPTCVILAAVLAGCGPKADDTQVKASVDNAPATKAATAPRGPPLPAVSAEGCGLIAAYVKTELKSDFGLPLMVRVEPDAKSTVAAADLKRPFPELKAPQAHALASALANSIKDGSQLDCDWAGLGLAPARLYTPDDKGFIRFRAAVDGDAAVLDSFTSAGDVVSVGARCLYRREAGAWTRTRCVVTGIS